MAPPVSGGLDDGKQGKKRWRWGLELERIKSFVLWLAPRVGGVSRVVSLAILA
jgi:hypothetical protein